MKRLPSQSRSCTHLRQLKITNSDKINIKREWGVGRIKKNKIKPHMISNPHKKQPGFEQQGVQGT